MDVKIGSYTGFKIDRKVGRKMIVKTINSGRKRFVHCTTATIVPVIQPEGQKPVDEYEIVYEFLSGHDRTFPLSKGDKIFFMNDNGKTIDRDFRMM